jgi:hypothetical protein
MGYDQRFADGINPIGPADFSKAVISIWFNAPSASLAEARAQYDAALAVYPDTDFSLSGIVPVVTYGPTSEEYRSYGTAPDLELLSHGPMSPSVIGIACGDSGDGVYRNTLYARMQYSTGSIGPADGNIDYNDFFQVGAQLAPCSIAGITGDGSFITVAGDVWHHALVSFDLSGGCAVHSDAPYKVVDQTCPFFWSFDDVNYKDGYLWPNTPQVVTNGGSVANGIFSDRCLRDLSHNFSAGAMPTTANPIGLPAVGGLASRIYPVSTARFQMFTGVTIDTSIEANRRAFITADRRPADPKLAAQLLGKQPLYRFDTSKDWIDGNNRGTAGRFAPTGTIRQTTGP